MLLSTRRNYGTNLFDDFFNDSFLTLPSERQVSLMKTDIQDTGSSYLLEVELPGYQKEDIHAELKSGYLTVIAESKAENEEKDNQNNYIRRERFSGSCKRSFYVGADLRQEDIKASYENGILKLIVPKEAPKPVVENHFITIE